MKSLGFCIISCCFFIISAIKNKTFINSREIVFYESIYKNDREIKDFYIIDKYFKSSIFRETYLGSLHVPTYYICGKNNILLDSDYSIIPVIDFNHEELNIKTRIYADINLFSIIKVLEILKDYDVVEMRLTSYGKWEILINYKTKKFVKILFSKEIINADILNKLNKEYDVLEKFSYINILDEKKFIGIF